MSSPLLSFMIGTSVNLQGYCQVIQADEDRRRLIFSEKEASWLKFSNKINVGDTYQAKVGSVEDYGAFVHLRFPDGTFLRDRLACWVMF